MIGKGGRILVTTLTKRMSEDLTDYMTENGIKVRYLHSRRSIRSSGSRSSATSRLGVFDVLIGINLLREGLDIPECALVAILDADKEGFLRSQTSLVQTIGACGAQRRRPGHPVRRPDDQLAALRDRGDRAPGGPSRTPGTRRTGSRRLASRATSARRLRSVYEQDYVTVAPVKDVGVTEMVGKDLKTSIAELEKKMRAAAGDLEFEGRGPAARRDQAARGAGPSACRRRRCRPVSFGGKQKKDRTPEPLGPRRRRLRPGEEGCCQAGSR